jgi:hypothetical protein
MTPIPNPEVGSHPGANSLEMAMSRSKKMDGSIDVILPSMEEIFLPAIGAATAIYQMSGDDEATATKDAGSGDSGQKKTRTVPKGGGGGDTGNKKPG